MCHVSGIIFTATSLKFEDINGKKVIELGSQDVNGSTRRLIDSFNPSACVGVDIEKGPNVDVVCNVEEIFTRFKKESFDLVLSTEMLEHVRDWKKVISNIKNLCKPGGTILITTRSYGFRYHPTPTDFWRFEIEDMKQIFSDCEIISLESDYEFPGVFVYVKKPMGFIENDLSNYKLYSMITGKKTNELTEKSYKSWHYFKMSLIEKLRMTMLSIIFRNN